MTEKFKKDGKVAVLYSPGYGAGWSTWNRDENAVFDPELVAAVLSGDRDKMHAVAAKNFPEAYDGGVDDLQVEWIEEGTRFEITEYNGAENIRIFGKDDGLVA